MSLIWVCHGDYITTRKLILDSLFLDFNKTLGHPKSLECGILDNGVFPPSCDLKALKKTS